MELENVSKHSEVGSFRLIEVQPNGYADGQETVGTLGGNQWGNDEVSGIAVTSGANGTGYNFGERPGNRSPVANADSGATNEDQPALTISRPAQRYEREESITRSESLPPLKANNGKFKHQ